MTYYKLIATAKYLVVSILVGLVSYSTASTDCSRDPNIAFNPSQYYLGTESLTGSELKEKLHKRIQGHKRFSYSCVWEILKEADQDPSNSQNVIGFYTNRPIPKIRRDQGGSDQDAWNREHIWAKSHGFRQKYKHAFTDVHHLRATDKSVNNDRGNNDFDNGGERNHECTECREGDGTWEAPDKVKGDLARMMFYMATRYEGTDGETPDLQLVDRKTASDTPRFGKLCTLLEWHLIDPVSPDERSRNDVIYSWQGNRNPFIDHPEFVQKIWGNECSDLDSDTIKALSIVVPSELSDLSKVDGAYSGIPTNINDGDTFKIGRQKFRLWGYDSPEKNQKCFDPVENKCIDCGIQARDELRQLIGGKAVTCFDIGDRTFGRIVANCYVGDTIINHWMTINGWGVALGHFTRSWEGAEAIAQANNRGIWAYDFIEPYRWRSGKRLSKCR